MSAADPVGDAVAALRAALIDTWRKGWAWGARGPVLTYPLRDIAATLAKLAEPGSGAEEYVTRVIDALDAAAVERVTTMHGDVTILVKMSPAARGERVTLGDTLDKLKAARRMAADIAEHFDIVGPSSIPIEKMHDALPPDDVRDA